MKLAVLDDYQRLALEYADWKSLKGVDVRVFDRPLARPEEELKAFDIVCLMRERTAFGRALIQKLPNLKFVSLTGARSPSLDSQALKERGIPVSNTRSAGGGLSTVELRAKSRRLKAEHGVGMLIVDYLQLVSVKVRTENRQQQISLISRGLKARAKELDRCRRPGERGGARRGSAGIAAGSGRDAEPLPRSRRRRAQGGVPLPAQRKPRARAQVRLQAALDGAVHPACRLAV